MNKEDIESLGFKYTGRSIDIWFEKREGINRDIIGFYPTKIVLHYGLHDSKLTIFADDCGDEYTLFRGIIKSKEEAEVLLKQIGVNG